jgi:hypothetical protein
MFTGDLTHAADTDAERERRMTEFKSIASGLKVKDVRPRWTLETAPLMDTQSAPGRTFRL